MTSGQVSRLHRHLIAARLAAAHKDLFDLVGSADRVVQVVERLREHDPQDVDARLDLLAAAIDLGVAAARKRNWERAFDLFDLVHTLVVENHDPEFWEYAFWVPFVVKWPEHLEGRLGKAAEGSGLSSFSASR